MISLFKVVPLCDKQLRDVNESDILHGGLYRKCNVYKGGGGYDRFPQICKDRLGYQYNNQFVVQLYGCPLRCPYCYVTPDGIWGKYVEIDADKLVTDFNASGQDIFHLMGGAPALYIEGWKDIIESLPSDKVFHSDFMLIEKEYDPAILRSVNLPNTLYAVSIKGIGTEFTQNTGVRFNEVLFWENLNRLVDCGINFYFTFTGLGEASIVAFKNECERKIVNFNPVIFRDSFAIQLIKYNALA